MLAAHRGGGPSVFRSRGRGYLSLAVALADRLTREAHSQPPTAEASEHRTSERQERQRLSERDYSTLRAAIGLTRDARQAGTTAVAIVTITSTPLAVSSTPGS